MHFNSESANPQMNAKPLWIGIMVGGVLLYSLVQDPKDFIVKDIDNAPTVVNATSSDQTGQPRSVEQEVRRLRDKIGALEMEIAALKRNR